MDIRIDVSMYKVFLFLNRGDKMEKGEKKIYKKLYWLYFAFFCVLLLLLMMPAILGAIHTRPKTMYVPQEGFWYCEELKIALNADDRTGYVIERGKKIPCIWTNERNSNTITIQTSIEAENRHFSGDIVANLRCKSLEADVLTTIGENNEVYQFIRSESTRIE